MGILKIKPANVYKAGFPTYTVPLGREGIVQDLAVSVASLVSSVSLPSPSSVAS